MIYNKRRITWWEKEIFCFTSSVSPVSWPSWFFSPFLSFSWNCLRCLIISLAQYIFAPQWIKLFKIVFFWIFFFFSTPGVMQMLSSSSQTTYGDQKTITDYLWGARNRTKLSLTIMKNLNKYDSWWLLRCVGNCCLAY